MDTRIYVVITIIFVVCFIMVWAGKGWRTKRLGGHAESIKQDVMPPMLATLYITASFYFLAFAMKELFMSKDSNEYFWTIEQGMPVILFQIIFLSILTTLVLPIYYKAYGAVIFGSNAMRTHKGFDQ